MRSLYREIYRLVSQIPAGRVATYGQIASMMPRCSARQVGYALAATPDDVNIPWQRVINSRGEVSARSSGDGESRQKRLLLAEGVLFDRRGRVDLERCGWEGPAWEWLEKNGYRVYPD
ncbi:MAG: cysteine methyltransferase [Proteobacteria bacterium]|nr:MAG: cysteine methyltransferase [Pseudomonadota bacterium]